MENRIPPPLVMVFCGVAMWATTQVLPNFRVNFQGNEIASIIFLALGFAVVVAGVVQFRIAKTTVNPLDPEKASSLVTGGIYRLTRNPMYLGMALFLLAVIFRLSHPVALLPFVIFIYFITQFQIIPEERAMQKLFGEEFEIYRQKVRRWI